MSDAPVIEEPDLGEGIEQAPKQKRQRKTRKNKRRLFTRWLSKKMPQGLYARSLIIIIAPMVLLQSVLAFVFMERHWQTVTQRLSSAVTADIAALIDVIETFPQDEDYSQITRIAREKLKLNASLLPPDPFPAVTSKPFFSILDDALRTEITEQIGRPFWIDTVGDSNLLEMRVRLEQPDKVLRILVRRNMAYASNSHIFMVWMVGTSLVLLIIAILFLRNQIRPIQLLAQATEHFGKGRDTPEDFKLRGAREVRQASLAFLQMRERIERQMEQRTAMLTGVSHDLRTVLTRFKLQLALGEDNQENRDLQHDVEEMQSMLQGYIDFAKGQASEEETRIKLIDVFAKHRNEAALLDKEFRLDCPENLQVRVRPNAFSRLIANLVSNALRYADTVEVSVRRGENQMTILVDDDGPGIPADKREEVFKPFYRLDEARNLDESGTGLGLSIARDIARNHGGDINLHDSPLGGLRAILKFPV